MKKRARFHVLRFSGVFLSGIQRRFPSLRKSGKPVSGNTAFSFFLKPRLLVWKTGLFRRRFSKALGNFLKKAENRKFVRYLREKTADFRRISVKKRKKQRFPAKRTIFFRKSTMVFNNLWKTDLKTFHRADRKNMDIQSVLKTPVESVILTLENPAERQKNSRCAGKRIFRGVFPQKFKGIHRWKSSGFSSGSAPLDLFHDLVDGRVEDGIGGQLGFHGIDVGVDSAVVAAEDDAHLGKGHAG